MHDGIYAGIFTHIIKNSLKYSCILSRKLQFITFLDGKEIRVIMNNNFIQPFSISTFEDELYVTSPDNKAIFKMNKFGETGLSFVTRNIKSPTGIATVHKSRQPRGK